MAGRGPPPKPAGLRQRTNKTSTHAQLPPESETVDYEVPDLPVGVTGEPWHPKVLEWWEGIWRSPMASEFLEADRLGGLYLLADLYQVRWTAASPSALTAVAKEIRLQEVRFGLSPVDRRRLQWEVEKGEVAKERTKSRRERKAPAAAKDPRGVLRAM